MSNVFLKRINKEIEYFSEKKYLENKNYSEKVKEFLDTISIEIIVHKYDNKDKYYLTILEKDKLFLELLIPERYPFKPYTVVNYNNIFATNAFHLNKKHLSFFNFNKFSYLKYMNIIHDSLQDKNINIYKFFYKNLYSLEPKFLNLEKKSCYCCYSITCSHLWSPSITFNNLLFEHLEIRFIEIYSNKLGYKYLLNLYNQLFNGELFSKLPSELIIKILN